MAQTDSQPATTSAPAGRLSGASLDRWLLLLIWLFQALNSLLWLRLDSRFPAAQEAADLLRALDVADTLAQPSLDLAGRLLGVTAGQPLLPYLATAPLTWILGRSADVVVLVNLLWLALLLACTYGIARRLFPRPAWGHSGHGRLHVAHAPALATAALLSFYPLVFLFTRVFGPGLALAALVSLAVYLLVGSQGFHGRRSSLGFGLLLLVGLVAGPFFLGAVLGPAVVTAVQALRTPRPAPIRHRTRSRNLFERISRRARLEAAHWNLFWVALFFLLTFPFYLVQLLTRQDAGQPSLSALIMLDDALGGFFLLIFVVGLAYGALRLLRPLRQSDRFGLTLLLAWLLVGYLAGAVMAARWTEQLLPLTPVMAILSVLWLADAVDAAARPAARADNLAAWRRLWPLGLGGLALLVGLVNFIVISWGAPAALAAALRAQSGTATYPLALAADTAPWAPDRALVNRFPPQAGNTQAAVYLDALATDCLQPDGCDVAVLICQPGFNADAFNLLAAGADLGDRLRFEPPGGGPDFYRELLDAHYLLLATGEHGCQDALAEQVAVPGQLAGTSPAFDGRFSELNLPRAGTDGLEARILRREGPPVVSLSEAERITLLEHVMAVTPDGNRARQELSALFDAAGDPVAAIDLREEAVLRSPEDPAARVELGRLYLENGRARDAADQFEAALELGLVSEAELLEVHRGLATAYADLGRWSEAEQALSAAAELAPNDYDLRVQQGQFFVDRSRYADATAALLIARRTDPQRPEAYLGMAQAHLLQDDLGRAAEMFQEAITVAPNSPEPLLAWAEALLAAGDVEGALERFSQAVTVAPDDVMAYVRWIEALQASGQTERALDLAETLARTFSDSAPALATVAALYRDQGRMEDAVARFQEALALDPTDVDVRLALGELLESNGLLAEAEAAYRAGLEYPTGEAALLTALGKLHAERQEVEAARQAFTDALKANQAYWQAAVGLGELLLERNQAAEAAALAEQFLARAPDAYQVSLLLGNAYRAMRQPEPALEAYRQAIALAPDGPQMAELHTLAGDMWLRLRNLGAAQTSYEQALRVDSQFVGAHLGLGRLYLEQAIAAGTNEAGFAEDALRFGQARDAFETAQRLAPERVSGQLGLADLYAAYGRVDEAATLYQGILRLQPERSDVRSSLNDLYLATGRTEEVLQFYRALREERPDDLDVVSALARTYLDLDQPDDALDIFDRFLATHPDDPEAQLALADTLFDLGNLEEALQRYDQLATQLPDQPAVALRRARALDALERTTDAEQAYRVTLEMIDASPVGPEGELYRAYTELADLLLRDGRQDEALSLAEEIADRRPDAAPVHILLGDLYQRFGQRNQALAAYREALRLVPDNDLALSRQGDLLLQSGRLDEAQESYEAALAVNPDRAEASVGLARVLSRRPGASSEELARARELLGIALARNPDNLSDRLALGDVLLAQGAYGEAADAYQAVLLREPDNPTAFQGLGRVLLASGDVEDALASFATAAEAAEDEVTRRGRQVALAATLRNLGRWDDARQVYVSMLGADPADTAARIALGDLLVQAGDPAAAVEQYRLAQQNDPNSPEARAQLGKALLLLGDLDAAASEAEALLAQSPNAFQAHLLAAAVAETSGDQEAALQAYRQASLLAPDNAVVQAQLGTALLAAGQLAGAEEAFSAAVATDRRNADGMVGLGRVYLRQGAFDSAETVLREALGLNPDYLPALVTLGRVLLRGGRPADAISPLEAAVAQQADHPTARGDLADAYLAAGRLDEGVALYEQIVGFANARSSPQIGQALLDAGQFDEAIAVFDRHAAANPADPEAALLLAAAYRQAGRPDEALAAYRRALDRDPGFLRTYVEQADFAVEQGSWEEAETLLAAAIQLLEQNSAVAGQLADDRWLPWIDLARSYRRTGRSQDALAAVQAAAAVRPDVYQLALLAGDLLRDLGRDQDALAAYERVATLEPDLSLAYSRQGDVRLNLGEIGAAEAAYEAALVRDPNDVDALEGLGRVYALLGAGASSADLVRAETRLRQALQLAPENAGAYVALGDLYAAYDLSEDAIAQFETALTLRPDHPTARGKLADALLQAGQAEAALEQRLLQIDQAPNDLTALIALAQTLREMGRYDEAGDVYDRAIGLQPDNLTLLIALGDLDLEGGKPEEAADRYREVIERAADDLGSAESLPIVGQAQDQLGKALFRSGRVEEALEAAQSLMESQPRLYRGYLLAGDIQRQLGDLAAARAAYEAGVAEIPESVILRLRLGDLLLSQGEAAQAETLFQALIQENPRELDAYVGLARAHMAQASDLRTLRYEMANTALQTALRLDRDSAPALTTLGDLMLASERYDRAIESYQSAMAARATFTDDAVVRDRLAQAYAANGQWDEALQEYQRLAAANPYDLALQMALGNAYRDAGRPHRALDQFRWVNRIFPTFAFAHIKRGEIWDELGDQDEALAAYQDAVAADLQSADAHFTLAAAYRKRNMVQDAIAALETGLQLDPERQGAIQALAELRGGG